MFEIFFGKETFISLKLSLSAAKIGSSGRRAHERAPVSNEPEPELDWDLSFRQMSLKFQISIKVN